MHFENQRVRSGVGAKFSMSKHSSKIIWFAVAIADAAV
jgi:hypothetical protein